MIRSSPALALLLAPLLSACHESSAKEQEPPWATTFGGDGQENVFVAADASGTVALAGTFQNDLPFGRGKLQASTPSDDDLFVGMLDTGGRPLWSAATGSSGPQVVESLTFAPDGSLILLGDFSGQVAFGDTKLTALSLDAFLVDLAPSGEVQWVKHWSGDDGGPSGAGLYFPASVAATADGITFAGGFSGSIGFGGPPLDSGSITNQQSFVARVDHRGRHVFSTSFAGEQNRINAMTIDGGGDIYVAGTNSSWVEIGGAKLTAAAPMSSVFAARLGPDAAPRWAFQIGGTGSAGPIAVSPSGDVFIAGQYSGALAVADLMLVASADTNGFVLGVSREGKPRWLHDFPGTTIAGLAIDARGRVVVGGTYTGQPDFGGGALPELGSGGAFLATLEPEKSLVVGTLVLGVPDAPSTLTGLAISGDDTVVTGNFFSSLELPGKLLTETADNGFGMSFVARLAL